MSLSQYSISFHDRDTYIMHFRPLKPVTLSSCSFLTSDWLGHPDQGFRLTKSIGNHLQGSMRLYPVFRQSFSIPFSIILLPIPSVLYAHNLALALTPWPPLFRICVVSSLCGFPPAECPFHQQLFAPC